MKQHNFNNGFNSTDNFMSFKYKVKLLRHTFAYGAKGRRIAKKATIVVLSKDLTHFW